MSKVVRKTWDEWANAIEGWSDADPDLYHKVDRSIWLRRTKNAGVKIGINLTDAEAVTIARWEEENNEARAFDAETVIEQSEASKAAEARVGASDALGVYRSLLLDPCDRLDEDAHLGWVASAPESELLEWCEALTLLTPYSPAA